MAAKSTHSNEAPSDVEKQKDTQIEAIPETDDFEGDITDEVEAKRIRRKVDWRLLPLLVLLYTLAFLDRVNIGNARLWNLEKDLGMVGNQYNLCVMSMSSPGFVCFPDGVLTFVTQSSTFRISCSASRPTWS